MLKTLVAAVAIVGLIAAALNSSRLAAGSGCINCVVSESFTLQPTTIVVACVHQRLLTADAFAFEPLPATPSCPQLFARGGRFSWQRVGSFGSQLFFLPVRQ